MSKLEIRRAGDPILREKSLPVKKIDKTIRKLLDDMVETMDAADGVGLAAPQVGVSLRVIIVDVEDKLLELINPEIVFSDGTQVCQQEGCLSVPGLFGSVERALFIEVEALNRNGKKIKFSAEGFKAQAIQHEIDHLDGILFIDRASKIYKAEATTKEI